MAAFAFSICAVALLALLGALGRRWAPGPALRLRKPNRKAQWTIGPTFACGVLTLGLAVGLAPSFTYKGGLVWAGLAVWAGAVALAAWTRRQSDPDQRYGLLSGASIALTMSAGSAAPLIVDGQLPPILVFGGFLWLITRSHRAIAEKLSTRA
jgi:hypothetical protein